MQRLRRQRRRIALCLLLGAAAGGLVAWDGPAGMAAGALAGGAIGALTAAAAVLAAPSLRWAALKLALVGFLVALALRLGAPPGAAAFAGAAAALLTPAQFAFLDAFRLPAIARARVERRIGVPAPALWAALCPRPRATHWDPMIEAVRQGEEPDVIVNLYRPLGPDGRRRQLPFRVFDLEPGRHFKLRDLSQPDAGRGGPVTVASLVIEPDGDGARLTMMEAIWRPGLWTAFALWLDDYLADHVDRWAALLEGRSDRSIKGATVRAAAAQASGRMKPTRS